RCRPKKKKASFCSLRMACSPLGLYGGGPVVCKRLFPNLWQEKPCSYPAIYSCSGLDPSKNRPPHILKRPRFLGEILCPRGRFTQFSAGGKCENQKGSHRARATR